MCSALRMVTMMVVKPYTDTQGSLGPFFLSKDRFSFCSYVHLMFETNIDSYDALVHYELTSKWTESGMFRIYLTLRRLMSYIYIYIYIYIYGAPILDVSRSHTTTQHSR